jgi:TatD DNase family protein
MDFWDFHTHRKDSDSSLYNWESSESLPSGRFSVGLHPWHLEEGWADRWKEIEELAIQNQSILAIGECGFDRIRGPKVEIQKEAFSAQASLAYKLGIPVILHCVKGHDLLLWHLTKEEKTPAIIWHGWNLKPEMGRQLLPFSVYFSFGKHLLLPNSNASLWLKECPKDRIFFETDNSEFEISQIYRAASLILGLPESSLLDMVRENWNRISTRKIK